MGAFRLGCCGLLQRWSGLAEAGGCFGGAAEASLGIAGGLVNVRNVNVFIDGIRVANAFLTFAGPLAVPGDVSAALLKHSFAFVEPFCCWGGL